MTKFLHFNTNEQTKGQNKAYRKHFQSRTVSAEPPSSDYIKSLAVDFVTQNKEDVLATLKVGITFCSLHDCYIKEEGRLKALSKQTDVSLRVVGATINETHVFVHLAPYKGTSLTLRANKSTGFTTVVGSISGGRDS